MYTVGRKIWGDSVLFILLMTFIKKIKSPTKISYSYMLSTGIVILKQ